MYGAIHKALRMMMTATLVRVGNTDGGSSADVRETLTQVRDLLLACEKHIAKENKYVHPMLERARPGASAQIASEHGEHADAIEELAELALQVETSDGEARQTGLNRLYRALALFISENFQHMHYEETEHNAVLWAHYTDVELVELHGSILAAIPPEEMMRIAHWMIPAVNAHERFAMLDDMRRTAPAAAFGAMLNLARARLDPTEWAKLARALDVSIAPQISPSFFAVG